MISLYIYAILGKCETNPINKKISCELFTIIKKNGTNSKRKGYPIVFPYSFLYLSMSSFPGWKSLLNSFLGKCQTNPDA